MTWTSFPSGQRTESHMSHKHQYLIKLCSFSFEIAQREVSEPLQYILIYVMLFIYVFLRRLEYDWTALFPAQFSAVDMLSLNVYYSAMA